MLIDVYKGWRFDAGYPYGEGFGLVVTVETGGDGDDAFGFEVTEDKDVPPPGPLFPAEIIDRALALRKKLVDLKSSGLE